MTALTPIETRRAGHGECPCPVCRHGIAAGQRVALVRSDDIGHAWVHLRCCLVADGEASR